MKEDIPVHIRKMSPSDITLAIRLSDDTGWNQVLSDWQAYLQLEPGGCFVAELDGNIVATTTTINYQERFGWIGMVIVDPMARRRGIATRMVNHAVTYLESISCPCQKLDATEAGARVYEKMGFTVEYEVERWLGSRRGGSETCSRALIPLAVADLNGLTRLDTTAFGASRLKLLQWYCTNDCPRFLAGDRQTPIGYVVGRAGRKAWQVGPLVAANSDTAEQLMAAFLGSLPEEPVIADVAAVNKESVRLLRHFGFTRQRVLQRMYRGENAWDGQPQQMFYLAGFEYG